MVAGETTVIRASNVLDDNDPRPASPAPPIRVPNRVDTGAGGAAGNSTAGLVALLVVLAALVAGALARRAT